MMDKFAVILFWISLVGIGIADTGTGIKNPPQTALQTITTHLETLSRITNGIALQQELNSNSLKIDHLLAEILGMDPKGNGLEDLRKFDIKGLSERYASFSSDAAAIEKSSIDEANVQSQLNTLEDMSKDLDAIKKGEKQDFSEIQQKWETFFEQTLFSTYFIDFNNYINSSFQPAENFTLDSYEAFKKLKVTIVYFRGNCDKFMKYEEKLKGLWGMIGISDQLTALEAISNTAETYQNSYSDISALSKSVTKIRTEVTGLVPLVEKSSTISLLKETLTMLHKKFQKLSTSQISIRELTAGFPLGISDMNLVSKDLDNQWFVNTVARGNHSMLEELVSDLNSLKQLTSPLEKVKSYWINFKTNTDNVKIQVSLDKLKSASENVPELNTVKDLQWSSSDVANCLKTLSPLKTTVMFSETKAIIEKLKVMDAAAATIKNQLAQFAQIEIFKNETLFDHLAAEIENIPENSSIPIVSDKLTLIHKDEGVRKFLEGCQEASSITSEVLKTNIADILSEKIKNWDVLDNAKTVLKDAKLVDTLECLAKNKFDASGTAKLLKFGSIFRAMGNHYAKDKNLETFIRHMNEFKTNLKSVTLPTRPKRSMSSLDSLKNGLTVSQYLGKGVNVFRKLTELHEKKNEMSQVLNSDKKVFDEIKKILTSLNVSNFQRELKQTSEDLEKLESYAKNHQNPDLQAIGGIFENASTITGVSIDSKLLADPVSVAFSKSTDPSIRDTVHSLKTLGSLQLDFASAKSDLQAAALSVELLGHFFADLNSDAIVSEGSTDFRIVGFYIAGVILLMIPVVFLLRYLYDWIMRREPKSFRHLLDSGKESVFVNVSYSGFPKEPYLPLHTSILDGLTEKAKQCIRNGANVNSFAKFCDTFMTPLHMAIRVRQYELIEFLIKNGADLDMKCSLYESPRKSLFADVRCQEILRQFEGQTYPRVVPKQMPATDYRFYTLLNIWESWPRKFQNQAAQSPDNATHIVVGLKDGVVTTDDVYTYLECFFGNKLIMSDTWLHASDKWYRRGLCPDYPYRATKVEWNGKIYETLDKIHQHIQESRIPFLLNVEVHLHQMRNRCISGKVKRTLEGLGAIVSLGLPTWNEKWKSDEPEGPYWHDNMGHAWIIVADKKKFQREYPYYFTNNRFNIFVVEELLEFLFKFETRHWKLTGKKDKHTIEKWDEMTVRPKMDQKRP